MDMLLLAALLIGGLVFAINSARARPTTELPTMDDTVPTVSGLDNEPLPQCERRDALLSAPERSLYGALREAAGERFEIFTRPQVADLLLPVAGEGPAQAFDRLAGRRFDYVLCERDSLRALCAIEVDDGSGAESDAAVHQACLSAGLNVVRLRSDRPYSPAQLRALMDCHAS